MAAQAHARDCEGKPYKRWVLVAVLLLGTFCVVVNHLMIVTALPGIMHDFHIDADTGQWLTSGFLLTNGIMIPVTGMLMHQINSKRLFMAAMLIFLVGTIIAVSAPNFPLLLCGRVVQAAATGMVMPLMQTILLLIFQKHERGLAMGMEGLVLALGRVVGPAMAGWVMDHFNWRILFCLFLPAVLVILRLASKSMRSVVPLDPKRIDLLSLLLSTLGFGALLFGFSSVGHHGWSSRLVIVSLVIGAGCVGLFIWRELTIDNPMLNLKVLRSPLFCLSAIICAVVMIAMFGAELMLPLYIQNVRGQSALFSGLVMVPGAAIMGLMCPLSGIVFEKIGVRKLAITGMGLLTMATIPFVFLTMSTEIGALTTLYAVRLLGVSLVLTPITTAGMNTLPEEWMGDGTAVTNTLRTICGAIGTAVLISVMSDVTKSEMPAKTMFGIDPHLNRVLKTDAVLNGVNAAFLVALGFCIAAWALTFFIKEKPRSDSFDQD